MLCPSKWNLGFNGGVSLAHEFLYYPLVGLYITIISLFLPFCTNPAFGSGF